MTYSMLAWAPTDSAAACTAQLQACNAVLDVCRAGRVLTWRWMQLVVVSDQCVVGDRDANATAAEGGGTCAGAEGISWEAEVDHALFIAAGSQQDAAVVHASLIRASAVQRSQPLSGALLHGRDHSAEFTTGSLGSTPLDASAGVNPHTMP